MFKLVQMSLSRSKWVQIGTKRYKKDKENPQRSKYKPLGHGFDLWSCFYNLQDCNVGGWQIAVCLQRDGVSTGLPVKCKLGI